MDIVEVIAARVNELAAGNEASELDDMAPLVDELPDEDLSAAENWARDALRAFPTPLRSDGHSELDRRRAVLTRLAAEAAARLDRPDELLGLLLADWRDRGESPARYVEHLVRFERDDMAVVVARYVLGKPDCRDRPRIEAALESIGSPPDGWRKAVRTFATRCSTRQGSLADLSTSSGNPCCSLVPGRATLGGSPLAA